MDKHLLKLEAKHKGGLISDKEFIRLVNEHFNGKTMKINLTEKEQEAIYEAYEHADAALGGCDEEAEEHFINLRKHLGKIIKKIEKQEK